MKCHILVEIFMGTQEVGSFSVDQVEPKWKNVLLNQPKCDIYTFGQVIYKLYASK